MHLAVVQNNLTRRFTRYVIGGVSLLLFFFVFGSSDGWSQIDTGAVTGTLHDEQGATVAGATVVIRNLTTGVASTTKTNDQGTYQVLSLIPGIYSVEVTAQGFSPTKNPSVEIHVETHAQVDFTLRVGSVQEQIEVSEN